MVEELLPDFHEALEAIIWGACLLTPVGVDWDLNYAPGLTVLIASVETEFDPAADDVL